MNRFQLLCLCWIIWGLMSVESIYAQRKPRQENKEEKKEETRKDNNRQKVIQLGTFGKSLRTTQARNTSNRSLATFEDYKLYFFKTYWSLNPGYASYLGLSQYDGYLTVPNEESRANAMETYHHLLENLNELNKEVFSDEEKTDYALIKNELESSIWYNEHFRSYEWNPAVFNIGGGFDRLVSDKDKTTGQKLKVLYAKMKKVSDYYQAAMQSIQDPTLEHTQLAAYQIGGTLNVFDKKIRKLVSEASAEDWATIDKLDFENRLRAAIGGVQMFEKYLNEKLLPSLELRKKENRAVRSFRIGEELYETKFQYDIQSGYSAEELYEVALEEKTAIHEKMFELADQLWEKYFPTTRAPKDKLMKLEILIDEISQKHVKREDFMDAIKRQLPELANFVKEKDLLHLDPSKPLEVRATPEYMRGTAGASISAPGPFDKDAPTYYNVTPLDHYTEEQAESYLREYNHYMLQILNIHEAIPGHYAQLVYANQSPSLVKSIFGNGAMIEGWACYTERMMLEEGYGEHAPELWLMYYKWNLRIVCNTILDYSVHVLDMTREEALDLLTREAFQEQTEAEGKWSRVQLTQVQLCSYFAGLTEIYEFREEWKTALGEDFNLKKFHERFLSFGSAPVKEVKRLMGGE